MVPSLFQITHVSHNTNALVTYFGIRIMYVMSANIYFYFILGNLTKKANANGTRSVLFVGCPLHCPASGFVNAAVIGDDKVIPVN